jgi:hypothetical protein
MITSLLIAQHFISVIQDDPSQWSINGMGRSCVSNGVIRIKADMPEDIKQSTLLHEVIHMIADMNGIKVSESTVGVLENGLFEVLRSNPEFAREICRL